MTSPSSSSSSPITQIPDLPTHNRITAASAQIPTVIYVSNSALPSCQSFTPQYIDLAARYSMSDPDSSNGSKILFCQLEFSSETSSMFKFSPNQLPVVVLMCRGPWARTLMSPSLGQLEEGVREMMERAGAGEAGG